MSRIDIENAKTLRQAMNVICGLDVIEGTISSVSASGSYDNVVGGLASIMPNTFMDLSGGGFLNDGYAVPLASTHDGIVAQIGTAMTLTITLSSSVSADIPITVYGYNGGELTKWTGTTVSGTSQTITIPSSTSRIIVTKVNVGNSWWFDNSNLVSCNVNLRGVETKIDNPVLQMSEIEIKGYEPTDITTEICKINENHPIYYSAGYIGDMSPMRKFYLDGLLEWEDNVITIKGTDATRFLDVDTYGHRPTTGINGEWIPFSTVIGIYDYLLTNAGVSHIYTNELTSPEWTTHYTAQMMLGKSTVRKHLAQMSNLFKIDNDEDDYHLWVSYVDAGIPTLIAREGRGVATIHPVSNIAELKKTVEARTKSISINSYWMTIVEEWTTLLSCKKKGTYVKDLSTPYANISKASSGQSGTLFSVWPYLFKYKLTSTLSDKVSIRGHEIELSSGSYDLPYKETINTTGKDVVLEDFIGLQEFDIEDPDDITFSTDFFGYIFEDMAKQSPVMYEFTWRGDPRLQPRDYISLNIDGTSTNMTIESVTLDHQEGGLTSRIVARKGLV